MKKKWIVLTLGLCLIMWSCKEQENTQEASLDATEDIESIAPITDAVLETAIIYEANIRQYSPEGTFDAFTKDIPQLKELGVKIIWLMPIHPISVEKRKAEGDLLVADIEDPEERKKYLGSYYAVSDYRAINPNYGTLEDFRELLNTAHENDMYVILDWVPNHTGWDHQWISEHPDFYTKNAEGKIVDPLNEEGNSMGWTDVADLNYDNLEMQDAMIAEMLYWITEENVDGFRCDVAWAVPKSFWAKAIPRLRETKDIFMLAEAELPELMTEGLFDMSYGWEGHHLMNAMAKEERPAADWVVHRKRLEERWEADDILMNFITNHDENSWAGTVTERLGAASESMLTMSYVIPGMPLIYSGQEYGMDHRLKFFEKDSIPKTKGKVFEHLQRLGELKTSIEALNGGKNPASYSTLDVGNEAVIAFERIKGESRVMYIGNMSPNSATFSLEIDRDLTNGINRKAFRPSNNGAYTLGPWEYLLLVK